MEENKKNNGLVIAFAIVLIVAVIGIGGTIYFYNKSLNNNEIKNQDEKEINNEKNDDNTKFIEVSKMLNMNLESNSKDILYYLEREVLDMLPVHYDKNGKISSYTIDELSDEEKKYFAWECLLYHNYIYYGNMPEQVLQTYLGKDFKLSEFTLWNNFILKNENGEYVATTLHPAEIDTPNIYHITDCKVENEKLILYFDSFSVGYGFHKQYSGEATFELEDNILFLTKVEIN